ncbi:MAG TPA: hypothetical protein VGD72_13295 [Mycobacteriales bacterium]|jgi:hypothetical protein
MIRFDVLIAALLMSAPTLWDAFSTGNTPVDTALVRFLVAVPVCAVALALLRRVFRPHPGPSPAVRAAEQALEETRAVYGRRRQDAPSDVPAEVP